MSTHVREKPYTLLVMFPSADKNAGFNLFPIMQQQVSFENGNTMTRPIGRDLRIGKKQGEGRRKAS